MCRILQMHLFNQATYLLREIEEIDDVGAIGLALKPLNRQMRQPGPGKSDSSIPLHTLPQAYLQGDLAHKKNLLSGPYRSQVPRAL